MCCTRNKFICMLMILFVFVSGMYFEEFRIDSDFSYAHADIADICYFSEKPVVVDTQVCTTAMLGIRGNAGLGRMERSFVSQRRGTRTSTDFLCQSLFSLNTGKSYINFENTQWISGTLENLVAEYIHKSDGKKRI